MHKSDGALQHHCLVVTDVGALCRIGSEARAAVLPQISRCESYGKKINQMLGVEKHVLFCAVDLLLYRHVIRRHTSTGGLGTVGPLPHPRHDLGSCCPDAGECWASVPRPASSCGQSVSIGICQHRRIKPKTHPQRGDLVISRHVRMFSTDETRFN